MMSTDRVAPVFRTVSANCESWVCFQLEQKQEVGCIYDKWMLLMLQDQYFLISVGTT